jgi:hypothetical protein
MKQLRGKYGSVGITAADKNFCIKGKAAYSITLSSNFEVRDVHIQ